MATLEGTVNSVHGHTTVTGPAMDSSGNRVFCCFVDFTISGTYVQADNATLLAVPTAIEDSLRSGETVTLLDAASAMPGLEAGTVIDTKTVAVSGANITFELTGADLTTEHAAAALGTITKPLALFVKYKITS